MVSATADYALRAMLVLARREGRAASADAIADATGAPRNYMAKTLNALAKAGLVDSARGPQGGFTLRRPADTVTIAQVIECFDEPRPMRRCLLGAGPCDPRHPCAAHVRWERITHARRALLTETTVADLLSP